MGPYLATPQLSKKTHEGEHLELRYASCEMQGWRKTMEDADIILTDIGEGIHLFAVFDGHGGFHVSKFVAKFFVDELKKNQSFKKGNYSQALAENFKFMDDMLESASGQKQLHNIYNQFSSTATNSNDHEDNISMNCGCTANVLLITPKKYYVANAGDSRSVLCNGTSAIALSEDHKPDDPIQISRIQNAGGYISNGRVNGGLNLTRSIGDFSYKRVQGKSYDEQLIICKPDVKEHERHAEDEFIVLGCDGIWQKYVSNNQGMVEWLNAQRKVEPRLGKITENLLDFLIAKETTEEVGCDNMTAIIVEFKKTK